MSNYSKIDGARITEWGPDSEVGEPEREINGQVEEMYFSNGHIELTIEHDKKDSTVTSIYIPIKATKSWNGFVDSLPRWDNDA